MNEPFRFQLLARVPLPRVGQVREEVAQLRDWRVHTAGPLGTQARSAITLRGHADYPRSGIAPLSMVGSGVDRQEFARCPATRALLDELMHTFGWQELGLVTVSRMSAGGAIRPHVDGGAYFDHYHRVHLALQAAAGIEFLCEDETIEMHEGELWCFDNKRVHSVRNRSAVERLNLYFDAR